MCLRHLVGRASADRLWQRSWQPCYDQVIPLINGNFFIFVETAIARPINVQLPFFTQEDAIHVLHSIARRSGDRAHQP